MEALQARDAVAARQAIQDDIIEGPYRWKESGRRSHEAVAASHHRDAEGALNRQRRTRRPRHTDVDWPRTIGANLKRYQAEYRTVVPETLIGFARKSRTRADPPACNV
jgi:hypothetical protein